MKKFSVLLNILKRRQNLERLSHKSTKRRLAILSIIMSTVSVLQMAKPNIAYAEIVSKDQKDLLLAVEEDNIENLSSLLARCASSKNQILNQLLHRAAEHDSIECFLYLVNKEGCSIESKNSQNETPLITSAKNGSNLVLSFLLCNGANIKERDNNDNSILHILACNQNYEMLSLSLSLVDKSQSDINSKNKYNLTPLHLAIRNKGETPKQEVVDILVKNGADVNALYNDQQTPLLKILINDYPNAYHLAKILADNGADVNVKDRYERTPLHIAAELESEDAKDIIELLISKGADVNALDKDKQTPLFKTLSNDNSGSYALTKILIDNGAKVNLKDVKERTPLHIASKSDSKNAKDVIELLISKGADINALDEVKQTPLFKILSNSNPDSYALTGILIGNGAEINLKDGCGRTPLHIASKSNSKNAKDVIELLISNGAKIDEPDNYQQTPLFSLMRNYFDVYQLAKTLIEKGADVNVKNREGLTPLHLALKRGKENTGELVKLLISKGADVNALDNDNQTPLIYFSKNKNGSSYKLAEILIEHGADVNFKDKDGKNALFYLLRTNFSKSDLKKLIKLFGEKNINFSVKDNRNHTIFSCVPEKNSIFMLKCLAMYGDINIIDDWGNFIRAIESSNGKKVPNKNIKKIISDLIGRGLDINKEDKYGNTLLDCFVFGEEEFAIDLIENGADINKTNLVRGMLANASPFAKKLFQERFAAGPRHKEGIVNLIRPFSSRSPGPLERILSRVAGKPESDILIYLCTHLKENPKKFPKEIIESSFKVAAQNKNWSTAAILANDDSNLISELKKVLVENNALKKDDPEINIIVHNPNLYDYELIEFLIDELDKEDANLKNEVLASSFEGEFLNWGLMKYLIGKGADINVKNKHGETILSIVLKERNWSDWHYSFLLENGADVNLDLPGLIRSIREWDGDYYKNLEVFLPLVKKVKNINYQDENGNTLLHSAVKSRNLRIAAWLIEKGADITIKNKAGFSAFESEDPTRKLEFDMENKKDCEFAGKLNYYASATNNFELIKLLTSNGGTCSGGFSELGNDQDTVFPREYCDGKGWVSCCHPTGRNCALDNAVLNYNFDIAEILLKKADGGFLGYYNILNHFNYFPDGSADSRADFVVKYAPDMINRGRFNEDLDHRRDELIPLAEAIETGNLGKIKWLLKNKAKVDITGDRGETLFDLAQYGYYHSYSSSYYDRGISKEESKIRYESIIKLLIQNGANPVPELFHCAINLNSSDIVKILIEKGCEIPEELNIDSIENDEIKKLIQDALKEKK